jgi:hypothetical protein
MHDAAPGDVAAGDAPAADALRPDAPACVATTGSGSDRDIPLAGGGQGVFDASFAADPAGGRTWMVYSSVAPGPGSGAAALRLISTRLGHTDDGGATFCDDGTINAAEATTPPAAFGSDAAFWVHEVPALAYDALAPAAERWRLDWHRYLLVNTGDPGTAQQFVYSWIEERRAADPTGLGSAAEHKLFAAAGYASGSDVQAYNDAVLGPPEVRVDQLDPALGDCVVVSEPGTIALPAVRWTALLCGALASADTRIVLLADDRAGHVSYVSRLLGSAEAAPYGANGFSGAALYDPGTGSGVGLIATPTVDNLYAGCIGYTITGSGALVDTTPADGNPDPTFGISTPAGYNFSGACGYATSLTASGVVIDAVDTTATPLSFHLVATGVQP